MELLKDLLSMELGRVRYKDRSHKRNELLVSEHPACSAGKELCQRLLVLTIRVRVLVKSVIGDFKSRHTDTLDVVFFGSHVESDKVLERKWEDGIG